jgi:hypothetical protein
MYFPWNWEFDSAFSKLCNFGGDLNPQNPLGTPLVLRSVQNTEWKASTMWDL